MSTSAPAHGHERQHPPGHSHVPSHASDARYVKAALGLIAAFMVAEVAVGIAASSIALISDAGHMLTDALALALALVAMRLAARPAAGRLTFGWKRLEILSAQANGIALLVLVVLVTWTSVTRLVHPPQVDGLPVLLTALAGIGVNVAATLMLSRADRGSLNIQGAFAHVVTDLYAFVATAVAGAVVLLTGFARADAVAALVVAALMLRAGLGLVRDSGRIFLEAAPRGIDPDEIGAALVARPEVAEVHDLHVWEVTSGMPALSAHVLVTVGGDCHRVQRDLRALLAERWHVDHVTLQVDHVDEVEHEPRADGADGDGADGDRRGQPRPADGGPDGGHCLDPHGPVHRRA